jgi:hypothetical protein
VTVFIGLMVGGFVWLAFNPFTPLRLVVFGGWALVGIWLASTRRLT